ncbi:hypothetical protein [Winogradskyella aurantia]|uniref:Uncharacterized protein n=1 Tax=Winogradskyella aurantia TaxID=1915063 RepID=A0A265UM67_9FLAO|nr:hypothetical protein [Winogradskyella aurantia]OZV66398.1 hypothetical protein CA834_14435 [Winogradskyella aurantia]
MMKKVLNILTLITILGAISCNSDESEIQINPKSVTDCSLNSDPNFTGICLDGATSVLINETITYASKATANFTEIQWTINSGNIEIQSIENSIDDGMLKSIATIKFNSDFDGGSLNVKAINDNGELAEIQNYTIELEN